MASSNSEATVQEIIDNRRNKAIAKAMENRDKIYREIPSLYEIDQSYRQLLLNLEENGEEKARELLSKKKMLLALKNHSTADLLPKFTCPDCEDTGWGPDRKRCHCFRELLNKEVAKSLPEGLSNNCRFENFDLNKYPTTPVAGCANPRVSMTNIFNQLYTYAMDFTAHANSCLLIGGTGLGKTHLSAAMASQIVQKGYTVLYSSASRLVEAFQRAQFEHVYEPDDEGIRLQCTKADLLVIDDLGSEFITPFSQNTLYNVINERIIAALPTIISTNQTADDLSKMYNERIISRILSFDIYRFCGTDIRMGW